MDDEQDKRCHALINDLEEFRKSYRPTISSAVQAAHAQPHAAHAQAESLQETLAPPVDAPRYMPHCSSSTIYTGNETTHNMNDSFCPADHYDSQENVLINQKTYAVLKPKKVQNLDKTIESLWYAQANQNPNMLTNFSIDKILNTEQKHTLPLQTNPQGQDEKYNSQNSSRASSHSFEVIQYPPDSRTPLSMKKAASSAAKSHHLETNDTHDTHEQNGKNFISCKHSLSPYDQEGINLEDITKVRKQQMTLDIQPLTISTPLNKVHERKNYDLENTFLGHNTQYSNQEKDKNKQKEILESSSLQKNSKNRILENSKMTSLEKIRNHDNLENPENQETDNWHEANYEIRSPDQNNLKIETQEQDIANHPTLYSILNEKTIDNDRQDKPWNNKDIVNTRNTIYNTIHNAPISFSPCYTDGSGGVLHGVIAPQEPERYNPVNNKEKMYMKEENHTDKPKDIKFYGYCLKTALARPKQKTNTRKDKV